MKRKTRTEGEIEHVQRLLDEALEKETYHTRRNEHAQAEKHAKAARLLGQKLTELRTPKLL
jgi:hypothetical protein